MYRILTINPGSTSTKLAVYLDDKETLSQNLSHSAAELAQFASIIDQLEYRLAKIQDFLHANSLSPADFSAIVARGGLLKPLVSGTYAINEAMLSDLSSAHYGAHASNLGAILAHRLASSAGCPSFIVDPVVVDEMMDIARVSGLPQIPRKSIFHALNQKAVAKAFAKKIGQPYKELNLIVAHLGGGISVGCHQHGSVVDVNNCLDGEGPFSPERSGTLPAAQLLHYIREKNLSSAEIAKKISGAGGLVAHLGLNDVREVQKLVETGDTKAQQVYEAMIYQTARAIAAAAVPVCGKVDYILLTGGIAYSEYITGKLKEYIGFIAPVTVIPGENELQALAEGALRVLTQEESALHYQ